TIADFTLAGPTTLVSGDKKAKLTASVTFSNDGDDDFGDTVNVLVVVSRDAVIDDGSDPTLANLSKAQKIKVGAASKPLKIKLSVPAVPEDGDYFVLVRATGTG